MKLGRYFPVLGTTKWFSGDPSKSGKRQPVKTHIQTSCSHIWQENISSHVMLSYATRDLLINCSKSFQMSADPSTPCSDLLDDICATSGLIPRALGLWQAFVVTFDDILFYSNNTDSSSDKLRARWRSGTPVTHRRATARHFFNTVSEKGAFGLFWDVRLLSDSNHGLGQKNEVLWMSTYFQCLWSV